jgi:outer membrane protein assembly factor BamB
LEWLGWIFFSGLKLVGHGSVPAAARPLSATFRRSDMSSTFLSRGALAAAALALSFAGLATTANAATVAALKDGKTLLWIDSDMKKVVGSVDLAGGAAIVAMDVRPSDGKLYGVTADGAIVTIDAKTGKWDAKSQLSEKLPAGAMITVDFNPVADRMRILSSTGLSLRVNVDDGKATVDGALKYAETDASKGKTPMVTAGGYSNSCAGTKETALYDIDQSTGALLRQAPPNDGILNTIGLLGVKLDGAIAFDVMSDCKGVNTGWLLTGGTLHTVDLTTGAAKAVGPIAGLTGKITDMAILPAN